MRIKRNLAQQAPLAPVVLKRDLDAVIRYPIIRRIRDWRYGVVDGRVDADAQPARAGTTPWLHRLHSEFAESISHELQNLEADTAEWVWRLDANLVEADRIETLLAEAMERRAAIADTPDQAEIARRGMAELRDDERIVRARRLREYRNRVVAPADSEVNRLRSDLDRLRREAAELRAQIDVTHDVYVARAKRALNFYLRRAATYRRGFVPSAVKRQADREVIAAFTGADTLFRLPRWAEAQDGRGWAGGIGHANELVSTT